jgi:cytochrome c-type biogenesis protein CcmH/NrfG
MNDPSPVLGSKEQALANARRLLTPDPVSAERQARIVIQGDPECPEAHRLLGQALRRLGRANEAQQAEEAAIGLSMLLPTLFEAAMTLAQLELEKAERLLRPYLQQHPDDPAALRMLAEIAARTGHFDAADRLLDRALAVAPSYSGAEALRKSIQRLRERGNALSERQIRALAITDEAGDADEGPSEALKLYEHVVRRYPESSENWVTYGHVLRSVGKQDEAVAAYRHAIDRRPHAGEAWYGIADLKAGRFTADDLKRMQHAATSSELSLDDRTQLEFALGRAFEQFGSPAQAFEHYAIGNKLRAEQSSYQADPISRHVEASTQLLDHDFFAARAGAGEPSPDPIFILGMPRAGSTLIEQILSSHALVEATGELSDLPALANSLAGGQVAAFEDSPYLSNLAGLPARELLRLGRSYIWSTGLKRRTTRPYFLDKMPNNWLHLGLLLSVLPNAKIIDARRQPMACGFSNFRQFFAKGQEFSYDLTNMGRFYRDYVELLNHFDEIMPGRIYRVVHEQLVGDPETEIRRLLEHLSLDFDERCLRFHESKRTVKTASSEQVRQPMNRQGFDQWKPFAEWLQPLREALGPVVDAYPSFS